MQASFAFCKTFAVDFYLEQAVAVVFVVFEGHELRSRAGFVYGKPSELGGYPFGDVVGLENFIPCSAKRIPVFGGIDDIFLGYVKTPNSISRSICSTLGTSYRAIFGSNVLSWFWPR